MAQKAVIMDGASMERAITRISYEILERNYGLDQICLVGILTRGVPIAKRIAEKLKKTEDKTIPLGILDITPYRDDLDGKKSAKSAGTKMPGCLTGCKVILVDDVMYTGRTARAAIDAIMEYGRPCSVQLAVLIDRGHRELPIRPDFVGKNVPTSRSEQVCVRLKESDGEDRVVIEEGNGKIE